MAGNHGHGPMGPGGRGPKGMRGGEKIENPGAVFKRLMKYVMKSYGFCSSFHLYNHRCFGIHSGYSFPEDSY